MKIASTVLLGLSPPRSTTNLASHVLKYPLAPVQQNTSSSAGRGSCAQSLGRRGGFAIYLQRFLQPLR